jgi:hypothetical protein
MSSCSVSTARLYVLDGDTNILAFPMPKPFIDDQQELPLAEAC